MISVEEALERVLSFVSILEPEEKPILDGLGQVVAEDVASGMNIPPYDNTAMDGYAVRAEDTSGASPAAPVTLRVIGELAAGYLFDGSLGSGTAVRIMTGAPMPAGADAVVPFEETDEQEGRAFGSFAKSRGAVGILKAASAGANVRHTAEDVRQGQVIIRRGSVLHPAQIGVEPLAELRGERFHRVFRDAESPRDAAAGGHERGDAVRVAVVDLTGLQRLARF